jgi:predicted transposase
MDKEGLKLSINNKNDRNFITVECLLEFNKNEDKKKILNLMRKFSSMVKFAYKRLLEGVERKELRKVISQKYKINARYSDSAILLAEQTLNSCIEREQNPKKLVFGSRDLFEKLKKKHLTGKKRKKIKTKMGRKKIWHFVFKGGQIKQRKCKS